LKDAHAGLLRRTLVVLALWASVASLFSLHAMLTSTAARDAGEWARALQWQLASWWSWLIFTPIVVAYAGRAVATRSAARLAASHVALGAAVALTSAAAAGIVRWLLFAEFRRDRSLAGAAAFSVATEWIFHMLVYAAVVGIFFAWRAARLEGQLAKTRLDAITAQLRPHFLFNALNTVSALVTENPQAANEMIARLSELLRRAVGTRDEPEIVLAEELRLLDHYVKIQRIRFGDRVQVSVDVLDEVTDALVPPLLLQPLVENAIVHGLAGRDGNAEVSVEVRGRREGDRLRLTVCDNGPGLPPDELVSDGLGLTVTRARLQSRFGARQSLQIANAPSGGALVRIVMPFHSHAGADRRR
jgi:signal transduction histidine kinase